MWKWLVTIMVVLGMIGCVNHTPSPSMEVGSSNNLKISVTNKSEHGCDLSITYTGDKKKVAQKELKSVFVKVAQRQAEKAGYQTFWTTGAQIQQHSDAHVTSGYIYYEN